MVSSFAPRYMKASLDPFDRRINFTRFSSFKDLKVGLSIRQGDPGRYVHGRSRKTKIRDGVLQFAYTLASTEMTEETSE